MWKPSDAFSDVGRDKHVRALPGAQPQAPAARPDPPETHNLEAFWSLSWRLAGGDTVGRSPRHVGGKISASNQGSNSGHRICPNVAFT